jgi:hypothetical protein
MLILDGPELSNLLQNVEQAAPVPYLHVSSNTCSDFSLHLTTTRHSQNAMFNNNVITALVVAGASEPTFAKASLRAYQAVLLADLQLTTLFKHHADVSRNLITAR